MLRISVIPHHDGSLLPFDSRLKIGSKCNMVVKEVQNEFRLLLLEADNLSGDYSEVLVLLSLKDG